MNYEQKYKEALERARIWKDKSGMPKYKQGILDDIFPELTESEDERIKKELISFLQLPHLQFVGERKQERWLAWLEKQGQVKESTISHEEDERIRKGIIRNLEYLADRAEGFVKDELKERITWLEKQGEQKPYGQRQECADCQFNYAGECKGSCAVKRSEQKSTDKVEPKFKKGDWIVQGCNILKIRCFDDKYYCFETVEGYVNHMLISEIDSLYHLWTIQDAKDGYILAESKGDVILMFRGIGNTRWDDVIDYHFYYDCYRENFIVQEDVNYWGNTENNQLKPATKEQRDLLFQKIRESGYEWDAEEKELKKIEDEPENYKQQLMSEMTNLVKDYIRQKPSWSEEDETKLKSACALIRNTSLNGHEGVEDSTIDWLKSLKERIKK